MSALVLFLALTAAGDEQATSSLVPQSHPLPDPAASRLGFHEYERQITDLLRREAQNKETSVQAGLVRGMCRLHAQIVADERYASSDTLKRYRARLWSRLTRIKADLKQQLARDARANQDALNDIAALEAADPASIAASQALAASLNLLDQSQGGPSYLLSFGGAAVPGDYGPDLVALIERTINPSYWDVAGGPGSIVYYAPLQCLVVRATGEIHEKIGGVVGGLRAAGK